MKVTDVTREVLNARRERRRLLAAGYEFQEGPWELHRGNRMNHRIVDVRISASGKDIWVKTEPRPHQA